MSSIQNMQSAGSLFDRFLRPYWKSVLAIVLLSVVVGFLTSMRPLVFAPALEAFVENNSRPAENVSEISLNNIGQTLITLLEIDTSDLLVVGFFVSTLFIIISIAIAAFGALAETLLITSRTSVIRDMMMALHRHLLTLPLAYFNNNKTGDLVSRLNNDVSTTALSLDSIARGVIQSLVQILVTMVILLRTDPSLCLVVFALGSLHMVITKALGKSVRLKAKKMAETHGMVWARVMESFSGIRLIKSFGAEDHEFEKMSHSANSLRDNIIRFRLTKYIEIPARLVLDALIIGIVLYLAFSAMSGGRLTPQAAALFFYVSQQLITPISEFFRHTLSFHSLFGSAERVIEIFETKSTIIDGEIVPASLKKQITLDNISFGYEKDNLVLKNINLEINRGETVAIVGPSGAGKSTLVDMILRLYDVESGSITYDGVDIRKFRQGDYRKNFGVVAQESLLLNDTIKNNIIFNNPENQERLEHAIWLANVEEFVRNMPKGLGTYVGDRGVRVSGGQRQRIALARAIYNDPCVLAFDEATSSLDSKSEKMIQDAINKILKEMTAIIIAHRLSTITQADKIVVVNNGEIEAVGAHNMLLDTSPTYKMLSTLQFADASFGEKSPEKSYR